MKPEQQTVSRVRSSPRRDQEIDRRYGDIGISAVAAAVRCQNLGGASEPQHERDERIEMTPRAA